MQYAGRRLWNRTSDGICYQSACARLRHCSAGGVHANIATEAHIVRAPLDSREKRWQINGRASCDQNNYSGRTQARAHLTTSWVRQLRLQAPASRLPAARPPREMQSNTPWCECRILMYLIGSAIICSPSCSRNASGNGSVNKVSYRKQIARQHLCLYRRVHQSATLSSDVNKTFFAKTKTKTLPGPLNRLPYHGHKMNKTVYTRHA